MNEVITMIKGLPTWSYIVAGLAVFYIIMFTAPLKYSKNKRKRLLGENPDAALIYTGTKQKGIKTVQIAVNTIDGMRHTDWFNEGLSLVYAVKAGTHTIEASATTTRPGIMYKHVSETFGPLRVEVEVASRKKYELNFDVKEQEFTFTEIQG